MSIVTALVVLAAPIVVPRAIGLFQQWRVSQAHAPLPLSPAALVALSLHVAAGIATLALAGEVTPQRTATAALLPKWIDKKNETAIRLYRLTTVLLPFVPHLVLLSLTTSTGLFAGRAMRAVRVPLLAVIMLIATAELTLLFLPSFIVSSRPIIMDGRKTLTFAQLLQLRDGLVGGFEFLVAGAEYLATTQRIPRGVLALVSLDSDFSYDGVAPAGPVGDLVQLITSAQAQLMNILQTSRASVLLYGAVNRSDVLRQRAADFWSQAASSSATVSEAEVAKMRVEMGDEAYEKLRAEAREFASSIVSLGGPPTKRTT
ncbi:uncharacterized protein V1518DRAFT_408682 [Limtongia smithiae]|uniref:uncharacterized protein n=1 Tax=Limtongia smithiae TaxID=1125753 RepID=UPI0034CFC0E7